MGICYIIGAGECKSLDFIKKENDLVICADGGLRYAEDFGIAPDITVGDFDSYGSHPVSVNVIKLPAEKDVTDTHYAVNTAFEKGYTSFRFYGMLGGRIDHTLANIQLLKLIKDKGGDGVLIGDDYDVFLVKNEKTVIKGKKGNYVSVFSYSEKSRGVTIKGLKYEVEDITLTDSNPLGVSNEFKEESAAVEVEDGVLLIALQK